MGTGATLTVTLALIAALLLPVHAKHTTSKPHPRCVQDTVISVDWICGGRVYTTNPDGTRVYIGNTAQLKTPHGHVLLTTANR